MSSTNTTDNLQTNTTSSEEDIVYQPAAMMWKICAPVLIIVGTIANIFSILVLTRKSMRNNTTIFYLTVLSFGDMVVLENGVLWKWIKYTFSYNIRDHSFIACRIHAYIIFISKHCTTWILVAVTLDRCIWVCKPFLAGRYLSVKNARFTAFGIFLFMLLFHAFLILEVKFEKVGSVVKCVEVGGNIWPWVDIALFCLIPFTIMLICDVCIIKKIRRSTQKMSKYYLKDKNPGRWIEMSVKRQQQNATASSSVLNEDSRRSPTPCSSDVKLSVNSAKREATCDTNKLASYDSSANKRSSVTPMLLSVSFAYLILTIPIGIVLTSKPFVQNEEAKQMMWAVVRILRYCNNVIHFFLYCYTGSRFRRELRKMLFCRKW